MPENPQIMINDLHNRILAEYLALEFIEKCKFSFDQTKKIECFCDRFREFQKAINECDDTKYEEFSSEEKEVFEKYLDVDEKELKEKLTECYNRNFVQKTKDDLANTLNELKEICVQVFPSSEEGKKAALNLISEVLKKNGLADGYVKKTVSGFQGVNDMLEAVMEQRVGIEQLKQISLLCSQSNVKLDVHGLEESLTKNFMAYNDTTAINENIESRAERIRNIAQNHTMEVQITKKGKEQDIDLMYESRVSCNADDGVKSNVYKLMGIFLSVGSPSIHTSAEYGYEEYVRFWKRIYGDEKGQKEVDKTLGVDENSPDKEKERFPHFVEKSEELYANTLAAVLTQKRSQTDKNRDIAYNEEVFIQNFDKYVRSLKEGRNNLLALGFANVTADKDYLGRDISEYRARQQMIDEMNEQKIITYHHNTLTISGVIDFFKKFESERYKSLSDSQRKDLIDQTVNHIGQGLIAIGVNAHKSKEPKDGIIDLRKTTNDGAVFVGEIDFAVLEQIGRKNSTLREKFEKYVRGYKAYTEKSSEQKKRKSKTICQVDLPRSISENVTRALNKVERRLYKRNSEAYNRFISHTRD